MVRVAHAPSRVLSSLEAPLATHLSATARPLIVILGPTGSGKTSLSLELAARISKGRGGTEIINADSRQLYRFLDVGTAKIPERSRRGIPHHLLDQLDPKDSVSIVWYKRHAEGVIDDVLRRGAIPMLVGGSMLYLSVVIDALEPPAPSDPELRHELLDVYDKDGGIGLHRELARIDPESAASIPRQNRVYVIRALEIFYLTKRKASLQRRRHSCPYDLFVIGICQSRSVLRHRLGLRVKEMLRAGWIDEVRTLLKRGYTASDPGMRSLGYGEIARFVKEGGSLLTLEENITKKTWHYAKRQIMWWRRDGRIRWIDIENALLIPTIDYHSALRSSAGV